MLIECKPREPDKGRKMKILLFIVLICISSLAATTYKTSVFVVEKSTLYCVKQIKYESFEIIRYNPGDLVSGDYASQHCSYNLSTTQAKLDDRIAELNIKEKEKNNNSFGPVIWFLILVLFGLLLAVLP